MKHPNREQWVAFLYEDCDPAEKSELAAHLSACAACRQQLDSWRRATAALDTYKIESTSRNTWRTPGWLRWSAAAAALLAAGIFIGNALQSRTNAAQSATIANLQSRVEKSEADYARTQRLLADLSQTIAENRTQDQAALMTVASELKATRNDLETVAAVTEASLKLVRLASYTPPSE